MNTTIVLRPYFLDHSGEPVPEENFWTLWCKERLTEADTPTIRMGATPSGLSSAHLHHPPATQVNTRTEIIPILKTTLVDIRTQSMRADTHPVADPLKFSQIPAWYFHHAVVHAWLKTRSRAVSNGIMQIFQWPAECQLCCYVRKWVPSRFTRKSRTAWQSSIHLDDVVLK